MGTYRKPNVDLPVSLHDASVTKMTFRAGDKPLSGELILYFQDGYRALVEKKWTPTGLGEVIFSGIDWDFSAVRYFDHDLVREISFGEFQKDLHESSFEIVDESYGYNRSVFSGYRYQNVFFKVEMEIYHFSETEYRWKEQDHTSGSEEFGE